MACFLVPAAEAAVTTIAAKAMKSKERGLPVHKIAVGSGFENVGTYMIVGLVGLNFVFELVVDIVLSPIVVRLINIGKKGKAA